MIKEAKEFVNGCSVMEKAAWPKLDQALTIIEHLLKQVEEKDFVIDKFSEWYNDSECPQEAHGFCPNLESIKKDYIEDNEHEPDYDITDFSPCKEICGVDSDGECYAEYYKKLFNDKPEPPSKE